MDVRGLAQRRPQPLSRKLEQAEPRQPSELNVRAIHLDRVPQHVLDRALIGGGFHVDEIDHDQAADVTQSELARDLLGRLEIGVRAVASMSPPRVERAELMSMETSASVWSMTRLPPEGRVTLCEYADSIWLSIW